MGEGSNPCASCLQTINFGVSIAIIVLTVKIYQFTDKNPNILLDFDTDINHRYDSEGKKIPVVSRLNELVTKNVFELGKYCQCGEEILENICTEEQIISGCYDISKKNEKSLLRNLADDEVCKLEVNLQTPNFSKVFDLGFDMVYKMALGILIIYCAVLGVSVLVIIATFGALCCGECALALLLPCLPVIFIVVIFSGITNLVLFIIMMVNYYKGNTTGEFLDYYNNCLIKDSPIKKDIESTFNELDGLDSNFTAFVVLNFIGIFLNWVTSFFNSGKKEE